MAFNVDEYRGIVEQIGGNFLELEKCHPTAFIPIYLAKINKKTEIKK